MEFKSSAEVEHKKFSDYKLQKEVELQSAKTEVTTVENKNIELECIIECLKLETSNAKNNLSAKVTELADSQNKLKKRDLEMFELKNLLKKRDSNQSS